jgi:hypothetical protein
MRPRSIGAGVAAGIVGAILISICTVYCYGTVLHIANFSFVSLLTFDASLAMGKAAFDSPSAPLIGAALHLLTSIGWAVGYAYLAERQSQLITRPWLSGAGFGFLIYFAMLLVLVADNAYHQPTPSELGVALFAHMAFFGIPVALIVARLAR